MSCLQDAEVFQCARAPQLFQTEMCKRETKNRTHTPLSQLPLHRLWDCLCVSPLSSFTVPVSPPFPPSLPLYSPTFTVNQPYFLWPGLHHHERPETGHHFPRLSSIRRCGGAGCGNCLHLTSLWVFFSVWGWTQTLVAKIPS